MIPSGASATIEPTCSFPEQLSAIADATNDCLDDILTLPEGKERRVVEAMRYSTLNGGKRLRPFLVVSSADLFSVPRAQSVRVGAALEMVHCYSLIHDDLPAMDDDDLRRGQPTCHRAFDEATAILAGDALLTEAFAVLSDPKTHPDDTVRAATIAALAQAAGARGMVGGQMLDLIAETTDLTEDEVKHLQAMKTGRLLAVGCQMGGLLGHADSHQIEALLGFGQLLGAAFQIADDLLDLEASEADMGKATGKDRAAGKATFVSLYGVERARDHGKTLVDQAVATLHTFGEAAASLRAAAAFTVARRS